MALQVLQPDKERPSKDVAWYNPDVESNIRPEMRDLLLNYSKIPAEDLVGHITKVVCKPKTSLVMVTSILLMFTIIARCCVGYLPVSYRWLAPLPRLRHQMHRPA